MRKFYVAGNWKMNTTPKEGKKLIKRVLTKGKLGKVKVIFAPPFTHLAMAQDLLKGQSGYSTSAQNVYTRNNGAFTGEISAEMIASLGTKYVIIGHSERRAYFSETSNVLLAKVKQALDQKLKVIFCCGEPLQSREKGSHFGYVNRQLSSTIYKLPESDLKNIIIAYEPIWAIGTGRTAEPIQAQDMHFVIRAGLKKRFGKKIASNMSILYGGSVKPANALEIFKQPDVDGGLIGGASLKADDFVSIIDALRKTEEGR